MNKRKWDIFIFFLNSLPIVKYFNPFKWHARKKSVGFLKILLVSLYSDNKRVFIPLQTDMYTWLAHYWKFNCSHKYLRKNATCNFFSHSEKLKIHYSYHPTQLLGERYFFILFFQIKVFLLVKLIHA